MRLVLATSNRDKIKEIKRMLGDVSLEVLTLDDLSMEPKITEDGSTLEDNAIKKARTVRDLTGLSSLSDDSGLEVDALKGAPGRFSSRYAGENATYAGNNVKLLAALADVPLEKRTARFRCCMALALADVDAAGIPRSGLIDLQDNPGTSRVPHAATDKKKEPDILITEGLLEGRIALSPRGSGGFGYDPVFEIPREGKTLAELGLARKNQISHRYRALIEMKELILRLELAEEKI